MLGRVRHGAIRRAAAAGDAEALGRLLAQYGLLRAARERGFRVIDHDRRNGVILWARAEGFDPWLAAHADSECVLELVNATEEAGHREHFACRVPGTMVSARQAVAWTHGLEAHQYRPMRQS